ncbi:MAG: hypothetical protein ACI9KE_002888 [Polyangiales bacterium]
MAVGRVEAFVRVDARSVFFTHVADTELSLITDGDEGAVGVAFAHLREGLACGITSSAEVSVAAAVTGKTVRLRKHAAGVSRLRLYLRRLAARNDHDELAGLACVFGEGDVSDVARRCANAPGRVDVAAPHPSLGALLEVEDVGQPHNVIRFAA